jgi:signal transduction histidine kinase/ligand-binding sensor domain-containing protein
MGLPGIHRGERSPLTASPHALARLLGAWLLAGVLAVAGSAWALEPDKALNQFPHRVWQTDEGLPQNTTQALAQTPDGYLWAGTYEGLVRFDGVHFSVFEPGNTPELPDRTISSLAVDREGTLWINTNRGLAGLRAGRFFAQPLPEGIIPRDVHQLLPARDGSLWIATSGSGLVRLSGGRFQVFKSAQGLASDRVLALAEGADGTLWVASPEGLQRWNGSQFLPGPFFLGPPPLVLALVVDAQGVLWAGDQSGTVYRPRDNMMLPAPEASLPGNPISVLLVDRRGALWAASRGQGLLRLFNGRRSVLDSTNGLESASILTLFEDVEGSLWLGMGTHGLHRLKDAPFTPYGPPEGLGHDMVTSIREARDGSLWFGSLGGGITRVQDGHATVWTTREGLIDNMVFGSTEGRDGSLYFATRKGVIRWREGTFTTLPEEGQSPRNPLGQALYEDEHGTLWGSTQEGLARWDGRQFTVVAPQDKVLGAIIRVLARRAAGGLWIGTQGGGLASFSEGRIVTLSSQGNPIDGDVRGLYDDGNSLWVGTTTGLFRWRDGRFVRLTRAQGLFDEVVFEILPDGKGSLWMTCNKGIFRVSRQELEAVADGRLASLTSHVYGREDGLRAEECNGLGSPSGFRARDGRLWFPTIRGAVAYDAGHEKMPVSLPPVITEELWVDGRSVPASQWSRIPPGAGRVEIHYTSAALGFSERLRFRYKLEGIDPDWVEAGSQRVAYYTRIPPGDHRFIVEALYPEGARRARGAELVFHLEPRFFETILFRLGLVLALVLLVAGGVWFRLEQAHRRELKLQARVDERTAELAMRLRQLEATQEWLAHAEKLVAVGTLAAGVGHEINNPLAYILSNIRYLSAELREMPRREEDRERWEEVDEALADALHGAERVRKIVQSLKTLARAQVEPPSWVDLHAVMDRTVEALEQELRRRARLVKDYGLSRPVLGDEGRLGQVFLHLLLNAAQAIPEGHPESHEIRLTTRRDDTGRAIIEVQDTGKGIAPEILSRIFEPFFTTREAGEGAGLGLSICHATIESMGGEIQVQSEPGNGSTFRIVLPPLQDAQEVAS